MTLAAGTTAASPLRAATPASWAREALADELALLGDHAHLEKKAASNALELLQRFPEGRPAGAWVDGLARVARDETLHLVQVTRLLRQRGGELPKVHTNAYANDLRGHVRLGSGPEELVDRLLVAALIEARSAERFERIVACESAPPEVAALYRSLLTSERGHHAIFLNLAFGLARRAAVDRRWSELLDAEAGVVRAQSPGARLFSWPGD